jgi:histone acetyltransferase (RNA polymerase elongator complex component)
MCHNPNYDLEAFEKRLEGHLYKEFDVPTIEEALELKPVLEDIMLMPKADQVQITRLLCKHGMKKKMCKYRKNSFLLQSSYLLIEQGWIKEEHQELIQNLLRIKRGKSHSGIQSITIFTSPYPSFTAENGQVKKQMFSCKFNCHYCPNQPGQPRSYLEFEPGVMRANRHSFDACEQIWARLQALYHIGHSIQKGCKLEMIISGGTFSSYPNLYRDEFIRDTYYAANTFWDKEKRERKTLKEEIDINKDTKCRIIGLTIECRPDSITKQELIRLRSYGCTRVQLGVQHLDNDILKGINRQCTTERFVKAVKLLKDNCWKCDIHIMPNLPFSSVEKDREMLLNRFLGQKSPVKHETIDGIDWEVYDLVDEDVQADQWKLYPCEIVPYTEIEKWYRDGKYVPYAKDDLYKLLYDTKCSLFNWIRTSRLIRDIPKGYIIASSDDPNTGQLILDDLKKNGDTCSCIRCREVKEKLWDGTYKLVVRHYKASGGDEYFISAESMDKSTLYGFIRLRLCNPTGEVFPELEGCAFIRELHVYSVVNPVGEKGNVVQHKGIGKTLVSTAEKIATEKGYQSMAIIAGAGVKGYYEKLGYSNDSEGKGDFMIKYF